MTLANSAIVDRRDVDFLLFEWLKIDDMLQRPAFADHSRETLMAALDLSERVAAEYFLPHYKKSDCEEPYLTGGRVHVLPEIRNALRASADSGLIAAPFPAEHGGAQLPHVVFTACEGVLMAANIATAAYIMLTVANARLLLKYGTAAQVAAFAAPQLEGAATGTMCLSEPQAGSSLGDITTRALPDGESALGARFRLFGNKMWISGGDHDAADNIIQLVLAKVPDADGRMPPGAAGISLFVVPNLIQDEDGSLLPNDISVAGLNHKMGYRGTSNCLLNFGEGLHRPQGRAGAVGYLVGTIGSGLPIMFSMMNEARIAVGLGAAMAGYRGYLLSLAYAKERLQGREIGSKPDSAPAPIIAHPDVKRMLLAQKAYTEGALALVLYCSHLVDDELTHPDALVRGTAARILGLLTPVAKTWPSEWGLAANDIAIQIHGGYGYTRDFDVEQLYRDNRLNPIHEGTTGIQAIDLVRRKIIADKKVGFDLLHARVRATAAMAHGDAELASYAGALEAVWLQMDQIAGALAAAAPKQAIANATPLLRAFGHAVLAWLWLDIALTAKSRSAQIAFHAGKVRACAYFFEYETPKIAAWLAPVQSQCDLAAQMPPEQF